MIEASQAFQNGGTIVIWNDETEGEGTVPGRFTSTEIVISKLAKGNAFHISINYTHSSDLRTWQKLFALSPTQGYSWLGDSANARSLTALFQTGAIPALFLTARSGQ